MHIVYKLVFKLRKEAGILPYQYIGSKSNCKIIDGKIIDRYNKPYYGSSSWENYKQIVLSDDIEIQLLYQSEDYSNLLSTEYYYQSLNDVVADSTYFNKNMATDNNYTNPEFGTYKHSISGKSVRLNRTHPLVISGEYVGATSGYKASDETKKRISNGISGENNPFYGKTHSAETKSIISNKAKFRFSVDDKYRLNSSITAKKTFTGVPKTEEHKAKIGRKGFVNLTNINTLENIRISKESAELLDKSIWKSTRTLKSQKLWICETCNKSGIGSSNYTRWHGNNCKYKEQHEN